MCALRRPLLADTMPPAVKRWAWLGYLAVMTTLSGAYLVGPSALNSGPVFNLIGASAIVAVLVGTRLHGVTRRLPWLLVALGQTLFVTGDVIAYNYQRLFHHALPYPSIADVFYLAVYPALIAGILLLIRLRTPGRDTASLIDSLVIAIGVGVLSWVFLMAPYADNSSLSLSTRLISIAYPLMDVLLLAVILRLAFDTGKRERPFYLLVVGVMSLLVTDSVYGWLLLHGGYTTGGLLDGGWIAFYLLWGAAALHPSVGSVGEPVPAREARVTRTRLAVLGAAALVAPVVQAVGFVLGKSIDIPVTAAAGATVFLLVVLRMAGVIRQQERSEARWSSLVQNSSDVVMLVDDDGTIRYVSPSVRRVLGHPDAELTGTALARLLEANEATRVLRMLAELEDAGSAAPVPIQLRMRGRDGQLLEVETLAANLLADPSVGGIVLNMRDMSERKAFERQLERHAFYDMVTGLPNRALFRDRVDHALAHCRRGGRTVAVMFMDLDDFKIVNDSFGHAAGDALLREVGERLTTCLRASDTAARLGGDEFAILIEDSNDRADAAEIAERILRALEAPFLVEGRELGLRASLGIAAGRDGHTTRTTDELLRNADVAMYVAKGQGKSRYEVYRPTMRGSMLQRLEFKTDLRRALERHEFVLHYQPLVELETGAVTGLEALVRWDHPQRGLVPPAEFVPLAEETGLIIALGSWVLETACCDAQLLNQTYAQDPPLSMAVNLSARQLQWPGIVPEIRKALRDNGLHPSTLTVEVTESVMMQNIDLSVARLQQLKALGIRIAIDDFGAGYSSLNYIRRFPLDILKMDKAFVDRIDTDEEELALAASILEMAKTLNLHPVAEGVERPEQVERLLELECETAQGYYFAKPAVREVIEARLSNERRDRAA
jgi:diguanylate cyclase (GGDEF)-like protein/PAS domain S-box-containing protein